MKKHQIVTELGGYNSSEHELENCNFVKTVLMLLVILYHCCVFWKGNWFDGAEVAIKSEAIRAFAEWLNSFHVYAFVLVSGYVYSYLKHERKRYTQFGPYIAGKIRRLIVPYCFIAIIWVIPITCYMVRYEWKEIAFKFLLGTAPSQLWFLLMLFWCYFIAYFTTNFISNDRYALILTVLSFAIGTIGNQATQNYFQVWSGFTFFPFFILGMKLRQGDWIIIRRLPIWFSIVLHTMLFTIWYMIPSGKVAYTVIRILVGFALHYIGAIMAFYGLQWIGSRMKWKDSSIYRALNKNQMTIYLLHQQIVYLAIIVFNGKVNPYINCVLNFVIAVCVSYLIGSILLKWKVTRFLVGEK